MQWLDEATVADLLCHTSCIDDSAVGGIPECGGKEVARSAAARAGTAPRINRRIRLAAGAPLARRPGSAMLYSQFWLQLLGRHCPPGERPTILAVRAIAFFDRWACATAIIGFRRACATGASIASRECQELSPYRASWRMRLA